MLVTVQDIIILFGGMASFIMAMAFLFRARNLTANYWMVAFLFATILVFLLKFAQNTGLWQGYPLLWDVRTLISLTRPALIYLYIVFLVHPTRSANWKDFCHFLPQASLAVLLASSLIGDGSGPETVADSLSHNSPFRSKGFELGRNLYSLFYLFLAYDVFRKFGRRSRAMNKTRLTDKSIQWVSILLFGGVLFSIGALVRLFFPTTFGLDHSISLLLSILMILVCIILMSLLDGVLKTPLEHEKYLHSNLTKKQIAVLLQKLDLKLIGERQYRREGLKISDIAHDLSLPVYQISQALNESRGMSFPDYLNSLRIKEAMAKLVDSSQRHLTIEGIGYDVGFRSRASFYNAFKKITKMTPTAYRDKQ